MKQHEYVGTGSRRPIHFSITYPVMFLGVCDSHDCLETAVNCGLTILVILLVLWLLSNHNQNHNHNCNCQQSGDHHIDMGHECPCSSSGSRESQNLLQQSKSTVLALDSPADAQSSILPDWWQLKKWAVITLPSIARPLNPFQVLTPNPTLHFSDSDPSLLPSASTNSPLLSHGSDHPPQQQQKEDRDNGNHKGDAVQSQSMAPTKLGVLGSCEAAASMIPNSRIGIARKGRDSEEQHKQKFNLKEGRDISQQPKFQSVPSGLPPAALISLASSSSSAVAPDWKRKKGPQVRQSNEKQQSLMAVSEFKHPNTAISSPTAHGGTQSSSSLAHRQQQQKQQMVLSSKSTYNPNSDFPLPAHAHCIIENYSYPWTCLSTSITTPLGLGPSSPALKLSMAPSPYSAPPPNSIFTHARTCQQQQKIHYHQQKLQQQKTWESRRASKRSPVSPHGNRWSESEAVVKETSNDTRSKRTSWTSQAQQQQHQQQRPSNPREPIVTSDAALVSSGSKRYPICARRCWLNGISFRKPIIDGKKKQNNAQNRKICADRMLRLERLNLNSQSNSGDKRHRSSTAESSMTKRVSFGMQEAHSQPGRSHSSIAVPSGPIVRSRAILSADQASSLPQNTSFSSTSMAVRPPLLCPSPSEHQPYHPSSLAVVDTGPYLRPSRAVSSDFSGRLPPSLATQAAPYQAADGGALGLSKGGGMALTLPGQGHASTAVNSERLQRAMSVDYPGYPLPRKPLGSLQIQDSEEFWSQLVLEDTLGSLGISLPQNLLPYGSHTLEFTHQVPRQLPDATVVEDWRSSGADIQPIAGDIVILFTSLLPSIDREATFVYFQPMQSVYEAEPRKGNMAVIGHNDQRAMLLRFGEFDRHGIWVPDLYVKLFYTGGRDIWRFVTRSFVSNLPWLHRSKRPPTRLRTPVPHFKPRSGDLIVRTVVPRDAAGGELELVDQTGEENWVLLWWTNDHLPICNDLIVRAYIGPAPKRNNQPSYSLLGRVEMYTKKNLDWLYMGRDQHNFLFTSASGSSNRKPCRLLPNQFCCP